MKKLMILLLLFYAVMIFPRFVSADILQFGPASFVPEDPDQGNQYYYQNMYLIVEYGGLYRYYFCELPDLPHLGTLDQIRFNYFDNHSGYIKLSLKRVKISDDTVQTLAEFTTSGEASFRRTEDIETFTYPTIKSKGYRYFLTAEFSTDEGGLFLVFYGVRLRYYPPSS